MSQEDLAWKVGVSTRHIGFLEVGRSQPTREMVHRIAQSFHLKHRDTCYLLQATGFLPQGQEVGPDEKKFLHHALITAMRNQDPHPSGVIDVYGEVLMLNKAMLRLLLDHIDHALLQPPMNINSVALSQQGLQSYVVHWENFACLRLISLQQEILLIEDSRKIKLLEELVAYPGIPQNWQRRAVEMTHQDDSVRESLTLKHGYQIPMHLRDGNVYNYLLFNTTVGVNPALKLNFLITTLYPEDGRIYTSAEDLARDTTLQHPLLFY